MEYSDWEEPEQWWRKNEYLSESSCNCLQPATANLIEGILPVFLEKDEFEYRAEFLSVAFLEIPVFQHSDLQSKAKFFSNQSSLTSSIVSIQTLMDENKPSVTEKRVWITRRIIFKSRFWKSQVSEARIKTYCFSAKNTSARRKHSNATLMKINLVIMEIVEFEKRVESNLIQLFEKFRKLWFWCKDQNDFPVVASQTS